MTPAERRIAIVAVHAGPWEHHNHIVIAVADRLQLDPCRVEAVLERLRVRQVLTCVSATSCRGENPSVRYEKGIDWTDEG